MAILELYIKTEGEPCTFRNVFHKREAAHVALWIRAHNQPNKWHFIIDRDANEVFALRFDTPESPQWRKWND